MKIFKRTMLILISVLVAATVFVLLYLQLPKSGKAPSGERLEKISRSPHYKDGSFVYLSPTPTLAEGFSYGKIMYNFFFKQNYRKRPERNCRFGQWIEDFPLLMQI